MSAHPEPTSDAPIYFTSQEAFEAWLADHHASERELIVGFYKVATGRPSMTWTESVEAALCYGWIDGLRRRVDEERYTIRFTPRRQGSTWSVKNIASAERLIEEGRMQPPGLAAFRARTEVRSGTYSFEQEKEPSFDADLIRRFKSEEDAWRHFNRQPPGYRRTITFWVMAAKRASTREKRLARVIEVSAEGGRVDLTTPYG